MSFRILGLDPTPFRAFYGLDDSALRHHGVRRCVADRTPGYPDRIELRDAVPGETLLLLNHTHQPADNPYRASHAIFVLEGATCRFDRIDVVPEPMRVRPISLRAFDHDDEITDADLVDGKHLAERIACMLANPTARYLHAHYARRGCYAARIERA